MLDGKKTKSIYVCCNSLYLIKRMICDLKLRKLIWQLDLECSDHLDTVRETHEASGYGEYKQSKSSACFCECVWKCICECAFLCVIRDSERTCVYTLLFLFVWLIIQEPVNTFLSITLFFLSTHTHPHTHMYTSHIRGGGSWHISHLWVSQVLCKYQED